MEQNANSGTEPINNPAGTGDGVTPPAATPPAGDGAATSNNDAWTPPTQEEYQKLLKANQDLLSQRDRSNNNVISKDDHINRLESLVEPIVVERTIDEFLGANKDKFPDLTRADLMDVPTLDSAGMTEYATRMQTRLQEHAQRTIHKIENPDPIVLTEEQIQVEEQKLRESKDPNRFQKLLSLRSRRV